MAEAFLKITENYDGGPWVRVMTEVRDNGGKVMTEVHSIMTEVRDIMTEVRDIMTEVRDILQKTIKYKQFQYVNEMIFSKQLLSRKNDNQACALTYPHPAS